MPNNPKMNCFGYKISLLGSLSARQVLELAVDSLEMLVKSWKAPLGNQVAEKKKP